ncbi:MAG TPA: ferritin family protein [Anaeromyxobacteraceae bacterium]|nr:ferritin family protein [Anaeromyxobacteraceae bacterium]
MTEGFDFSTLTLKDALDLAIEVEEEARKRYEEFSVIVTGEDEQEATEAFRMMMGNEAKHGRELTARREVLFGSAPARPPPHLAAEVEAPDRGAPGHAMSAEQALAIALASEERAYRFYDRALPFVFDLDVRRLFEELREEELKHRRYLEERLRALPRSRPGR